MHIDYCSQFSCIVQYRDQNLNGKLGLFFNPETVKIA